MGIGPCMYLSHVQAMRPGYEQPPFPKALMAGLLSLSLRRASRFARVQAPMLRSMASGSHNSAVDWRSLSEHVFDETTLKGGVAPATFQAFEESRSTGAALTEDVKKDIVAAVRRWAESHGVVTYTHWFSPLRDTAHGTKVNTFIQKDFSKHKQNVLAGGLSVAQFFQTETDGSSFPNGGLRATHT
jgi:glutamine synthetase type III